MLNKEPLTQNRCTWQPLDTVAMTTREGPPTGDGWILKDRSISSLILNISSYCIISNSDVLKVRSIIYIFPFPTFKCLPPEYSTAELLLPLRLEARWLTLSPLHLHVSRQQFEA